MGSDTDDDSATEERLDRLESAVQQQNETIREMLPGRRAVLAGGAAAALGFAGGAGSASGQSAAGQIGTESAPVDVEAASVNASSLSPDPDESVSHSISAAVSAGMAVGVSHNGQLKIVELSDSTSDDVELQKLVDWIENFDVGGTVHFPTRNADGTNVTIESTVSTDDTERIPVSFVQHNGDNYQGAGDRSYVTTTIDDGSPMFRITGDIPGSLTVQGVNFIGGAFDLQGRNADLVTLKEVNNSRIEPGDVRNPAGDVITMEAITDGNLINNTHIVGGEPTARAIVFLNSEGVSGPGADNQIGPFVKTDGEFDVAIYNEDSNRLNIVGGSFEGGTNAATIHNVDGSMTLGPNVKVGRNEGTASGILHEGYYLNVIGSNINLSSNHGIEVDGGGWIRLTPGIRFNGIEGDSIHIKNDRTNIAGMVPYPSNVKGTVTYPGHPWGGLYFPDGHQLLRRGTATISAGTSQVVEDRIGFATSTSRVEYWIENDPGAEVEIQERRSWVDATDQQGLALEETTGNADVTIGYAVLRREKRTNLL